MRLGDFDSVQWEVAVRTYGNFHDTLIGMMHSWWNGRTGNRRVLVAFPYGRGKSDGLLCSIEGSGLTKKAILEIEGQQVDDRLGRLLRIQDVVTRILVVYRYPTVKTDKEFHLIVSKAIEKAKGYTDEGEIIIIVIHKVHDCEGVPLRRTENHFYEWSTSRIVGYRISEGDVKEERVFFDRQ
jgi:hypothetical protein